MDRAYAQSRATRLRRGCSARRKNRDWGRSRCGAGYSEGDTVAQHRTLCRENLPGHSRRASAFAGRERRSGKMSQNRDTWSNRGHGDMTARSHDRRGQHPLPQRQPPARPYPSARDWVWQTTHAVRRRTSARSCVRLSIGRMNRHTGAFRCARERCRRLPIERKLAHLCHSRRVGSGGGWELETTDEFPRQRFQDRTDGHGDQSIRSPSVLRCVLPTYWSTRVSQEADHLGGGSGEGGLAQAWTSGARAVRAPREGAARNGLGQDPSTMLDVLTSDLADEGRGLSQL